MAKTTAHYPAQFELIGKRTIELGEWEITLPTSANANSLKVSWYRYVAALKKEDKLDIWIAASRITATVKGNSVVFGDRNQSAIAKALDAAFEGIDLSDPIDKEFERLMSLKKEREGKDE